MVTAMHCTSLGTVVSPRRASAAFSSGADAPSPGPPPQPASAAAPAIHASVRTLVVVIGASSGWPLRAFWNELVQRSSPKPQGDPLNSLVFGVVFTGADC